MTQCVCVNGLTHRRTNDAPGPQCPESSKSFYNVYPGVRGWPDRSVRPRVHKGRASLSGLLSVSIVRTKQRRNTHAKEDQQIADRVRHDADRIGRPTGSSICNRPPAKVRKAIRAKTRPNIHVRRLRAQHVGQGRRACRLHGLQTADAGGGGKGGVR